MPKDLTVKDVLYALEYVGDAMIRIPAGNSKAHWEMQIAHQPVKETVANEVCASGSVVGTQDRGRQVIIWRRAA